MAIANLHRMTKEEQDKVLGKTQVKKAEPKKEDKK